MRKLSCAVIAFFLCACSGGGGDGAQAPGAGTQPPGGGTNPPPVLSPQEIAQRILEDCAAGAVEEFVGTIETFRAIFDTGQLPPTTIGVPNGNSVGFKIDVDDDGSDDVEGTISVVDAQGGPITINPLAFLGGLQNWLNSLPAGTRLSADFALLDGPGLTGNLTFTLSAGVAQTVEGSGSLQLVDCSVTMSFDPVSLTALGGAFPEAVLQVLFQSSEGQLDGTITLDGTQTAVIEVFLDGGQKFVFLLDLTTFAVTPAA